MVVSVRDEVAELLAKPEIVDRLAVKASGFDRIKALVLKFDGETPDVLVKKIVAVIKNGERIEAKEA